MNKYRQQEEPQTVCEFYYEGSPCTSVDSCDGLGRVLDKTTRNLSRPKRCQSYLPTPITDQPEIIDEVQNEY